MPVVQQKQFVIGRHRRKCTSELILFLADVDTENSGHLRSYYENLSTGCGSGADIHATLMCEKEVATRPTARETLCTSPRGVSQSALA